MDKDITNSFIFSVYAFIRTTFTFSHILDDLVCTGILESNRSDERHLPFP